MNRLDLWVATCERAGVEGDSGLEFGLLFRGGSRQALISFRQRNGRPFYMTFTETITETFCVVSCYSCGVRFGIGAELYRRVVTDAQDSIHCPACGKLTCWRESDDQKRIKELQRKLEWEAAEVSRQKSARDTAEASLKATKAVVTRMKQRAAAGTCPCCHRTFKQLAAHMAAKHRDFAANSK